MEHISSKYSNSLCCTVGDSFRSLQWNELECEDIVPLLRSLHEKGFLILAESKCSSVEERLFIFNYADLLETVNGSIFAPESFGKLFRGLCINTGIVTIDKLRKAFPKIADVNLIIVYLEHFQFCKELTVSLLSQLAMLPEGYLAEERCFFFPSLVVNLEMKFLSANNRGKIYHLHHRHVLISALVHLLKESAMYKYICRWLKLRLVGLITWDCFLLEGETRSIDVAMSA